MLVEVLLDVGINVHYGFLSLCSAQTEDDDETLVDAFRGQANGLVGAAVPEMLRIRTATHTGRVEVRIELHDGEPEPGDAGAEVVEVTFASWVDDLTLSAFEEFDGPVSLPPGSYQVRYSGVSETAGPEQCLLQFWPAAATDRIVRQTAPYAVAWHREGRTASWTAAELSARIEELRRNREAADDEPEHLPVGWPHHHLIRSLGWDGQEVGAIDPAFAVHLTTAAPETLRTIACWAAEQAIIMAGIRDRPEVGKALAAARRGEDLQPGLGLPSSDAPEAVRLEAIRLLYRAAANPGMDQTCSILLTAGRLTGGDPGWIVAAARQVFPQVVPTGR
ncbi:hypothetical protein [Paractinoplanes lichenicola]|uniref:HEAT repeat domain-containing protein n=1 Tax=Paractinoplanes lichenicola TaxID=2802976 RepID=A0ABS1VZV7_9ACTN|nr:hypothetical protein [Actinoplanes lichenicola]MBL7260016.1 hypothetical protein [Actinoplanes lichenicola]